MVCSSSGSSPHTLRYENCIQTLTLCHKKLQLNLPNNTPLHYCLLALGKRLIDAAALPRSATDSEQVPFLTSSCKQGIWDILNSEIPISINPKAPTFTALSWLRNLNNISKGKSWVHSATYFMGSGLIFSEEYKKIFLEACFIECEILQAYFQNKLTRNKNLRRNIDLLIRVTPDGSPDAKAKIKTDIGIALRNIVGYNHVLRPPIDIGDNAAVFTVGTADCNIDLHVIFGPETILPELFTQQGLCLSLHELINKDLEDWPDVRPETIGLSPNLIAFDRGLHIVRCEHNRDASNGNRGLLKKDLLMETTGGLGVQQGLRKFTLTIYIKTRNTPHQILNDAERSFKDHLPQSLGAFIAYRLHWLLAMRRIPEPGDILSALAQKLDFPITDDTPSHLLLTYKFLQERPDRFMDLVVVLNFCMLLSFLINPNGAVSLGLREGNLSLRLLMDQDHEVYFQRQLQPKQTLTKIQQLVVEQPLEESIKNLIDAYFLFLGLQKDTLSKDDQSCQVLKACNGDPQAYIDIWAYLANGTPLPSHLPPENPDHPKTMPEAPPRTLMQDLIKDRKWKEVYERLQRRMNTNFPENLMPIWGDYLWILIENWHSLLTRERPGSQEIEGLQKLLNFYARGLTHTGSHERCEKLINLMQQILREEQFFSFLMEHKKISLGPFTNDHIDSLLMAKIRTATNSARLIDLHSYYPEQVLEHVIGCLRTKEPPKATELVIFVDFLNAVDKSKLKDLIPFLTRRLIKQFRAEEAHRHGWLKRHLNIFENVFLKATSKANFLFAANLLTQWKIYDKRSELAEIEFKIISQMSLTNPCTANINRVIQFTSRHLRDPVRSAQSVKLCLKLVEMPDPNDPSNILHYEAKTARAIWKTVKGTIGNNPKLATRNDLINLLSQLMRANAYSKLWEYLQFVITKTDFWNMFEDGTFQRLLAMSLQKTCSPKLKMIRTKTIAAMYQSLEKKTYLAKDLSTPNGLTLLLLVNLIHVMKEHPDPAVCIEMWHSSYRLLFQVYSKSLIFREAHLFNQCERLLDTHGIEKNWTKPTGLSPRGSVIVGRAQKWIQFILLAYTVILVATFLDYQNSIASKEG